MGEPMRVNTICHDCGGSGIIVVARAATTRTDGGFIHTAPEQQTCKTCKGKGKLPGVVAPV